MDSKLKFVLFLNKNKTKDIHPDFQGNVEKDGKRFQVSAWKHKDKHDKEYLSGKIDFGREVIDRKNNPA